MSCTEVGFCPPDVGMFEYLITPGELAILYPLSGTVSEHVAQSREQICAILAGRDRRLLVIVGPCSIHDPAAALLYAKRLVTLRNQYRNTLEIVMRTYFEKPRTVSGWRGLIFDPNLNGASQPNLGLKLARWLLLQINQLGLPTATEFLDSFISRYLADLISWGGIGARTVESQIHRNLASSLLCPIGFKNRTDGDFRVAIDAMRAAREPQPLLDLDEQGRVVSTQSEGNSSTHLVLRGGEEPNYQQDAIHAACLALRRFGFPGGVIVDFSHANCQGDYRRQLIVCDDVCCQIRSGIGEITGVMFESFLLPGRQDLAHREQLIGGMSVTDPCLGWQETELVIEQLADAVSGYI